MGQDASFTELWGRVEGMLTSVLRRNICIDGIRPRADQRACPGGGRRTGQRRSARARRGVAGDGQRQCTAQPRPSPAARPARDRSGPAALARRRADGNRPRRRPRARRAFRSGVAAGRRGRRSRHGPARSRAARAVGARAIRPRLDHEACRAVHLRGADDEGYERFKRSVHAMGTSIIAPLAEALSSEQDARSRRRLRDILIGFGAQGRESVQQLMSAPNWEVRRTAAFLLREFGGTEGLKELVPLLADSEPLVQREAVQGLVMNGSDEASAILLARAHDCRRTDPPDARERTAGAARRTGGADVYGYLIRHLPRRALPQLYIAAVEALGTLAAAGGGRRVERRAASRRILGADAHAAGPGRRRRGTPENRHAGRARRAARRLVARPARRARRRPRRTGRARVKGAL